MKEADEIYEKALEKWGPEAQADMVVEECSELIKSIMHYKRGRANFDEIAEEIADVSIVIEQLALVVGRESVEGWRAAKLIRLNQRVSGEWEK